MSDREIPDKLGRVGKAKGGRTPGSKSARSLRQNKLKAVLDVIDPLLAKAMKKAEQILDAPLDGGNITGAVQLQACKLVIDKAIELRQEVYGKEKDQKDDGEDEGEEESTSAVLSLSVISNNKK